MRLFQPVSTGSWTKAEDMVKFAGNPDYRAYERLLRKVHRLIAEGQGDSADADALREQMELPARALSAEEMAQLDGLSADLYVLQGKEVPARDWQRWSPDELRNALGKAWQSAKWGAMLTVLRQNAVRILEPAQIAYFRGRAYEELGHLETAAEFMRYAAQLNRSFHYFELDLVRRVDPEEALRLAQHDLETEHETFAVKSLAAGIVFQSTRRMAEPESRPVYEKIVSVLKGTLGQQPKNGPILPAVQAHAFITLGLALDALGRSDEALHAYDRAVEAEPNNDAALIGRAVARLSRNPVAALADFQRAIALGTKALVAYVAVGLEAMRAGRYQQASTIIDLIRRITVDRRALALASEWAAIIAAETRQPPDVVRAWFRAATELDPGNIHIQRNAEVFEERLRRSNGGPGQPGRWAIDEPLDLHEERALISEMSRAPLAVASSVRSD